MLVDMVEVGERGERKGVESSDEVERSRTTWFEDTGGSHGDDDKRILAAAVAHFDVARALPDPVEIPNSESRWFQWNETFASLIRRFTNCRQVLHYAQSKIPFDHREPAREYIHSFGYLMNMIHSEFMLCFNDFRELGDHPESLPATIKNCGGVLISNIFLWHLRSILFLYVHAKPKRILEIGGGYGTACRLWMTSKQAKIEKYYIVDLPGSLFFSEVCLRKEFGGDVGYWDGADPDTRIVLVPIGRLKEFKAEYDLVINIGSMQEMDDPWIDFYMKWLDDCGARYFYSLNYMGQPLELLFESRTLWAPRPSSQWVSRVINPDPPLVKFLCSGRNFAEILYERAASPKTLKDWSALKGDHIDRKVYLDGLDLLRMEPTWENSTAFIDRVVNGSINAGIMPIPKEIMLVAASCLRERPTAELKVLVDHLSAIIKNVCI